MLDNLSFSRFKAYFRVLSPVHLPDYTGSTFRGALGYALRQVHFGMTKNCKDCVIRPECRHGNLYAYFFESPWDHPFIVNAHNALNSRFKRETYPQPFISEPPPGGDYLPDDFLILPFTLVGMGVSYFPYMACAMTKLSYGKFGRGQGRIALEAIVDGSSTNGHDETLIYEGIKENIVGPCQVVDFDLVRQWTIETIPPERKITGIKVRFLTPFRYKYEDKLGRPLTFEILMKNLFRRFTLLSVHSPIRFEIDFKELLSQAIKVKTEKSMLEWYKWERYSETQQERMNFDGFIGEIVFSGDLKVFLPYLRMGEFLNVGKHGSFGLGKYELSFITEPF